jgi:diguanylate cyclase (GGDEF)-like protein
MLCRLVLLLLLVLGALPSAALASSGNVAVPLRSDLCTVAPEGVADAVSKQGRFSSLACADRSTTEGWTWFAHRRPQALHALPGEWQLLVDQVRFSSIRIIVTHENGAWSILRNGGDLDEHRSYGNHLRFSVDIPGRQVTGVFIGFENIDDPRLLRSVRALSPRAYGEFRMEWYALAALFVGAVGSCLAYNLFLFSWLRTPFQHWYLIWCASAFAYSALWTGAALELLPWLTGPAVVRINLVLLGVLVASGVAFFIALVGRSVLPLSFVRAGHGVAVAALITSAAAAADRIIPAVIGDLALNIAFVASIILIIAGVVLALRARSRAVWFYIAAWVPVLVVFALRVARNFGLLPQSDLIDMASFAAIALESVVLSLAVADRFRELRRSNDAAQAERETLQRVATTDALTGLGNRAAFQERLAQLAREEQPSAALVLVDIDYLKEVNDRLGHDAGDELIREVSSRLRTFARPKEFVARIGGDEFAILITEGAECRIAALEKMVEQTGQVVLHLTGGDVGLSLSAGAAVWENDGGDVARLYKHADLALYAAKRDGRGRCCRYNEAMRSNRDAARAQVAAARTALTNSDFVVHYQPIIDLRSGATIAREALLRWQQPGGGLATPGEFAAALEDRLLLPQIQEWVLSAVLDDLRADLDQGRPGLLTGVNFVAGQLQGEAAAEYILDCLAARNLPASLLSIEVTETVILGRSGGPVVECLSRLRAAGATIALDDFGTGYASLLHLRDLPADALKIDQSFVAGLPHDEGSKKIVRAIIALAHGLGKHVVAEGIETEDQRSYLRRLGCDLGQGYLLGRPACRSANTEEDSCAA